MGEMLNSTHSNSLGQKWNYFFKNT